MKRIIRRGFGIVALASCIATALMAVRGYQIISQCNESQSSYEFTLPDWYDYFFAPIACVAVLGIIVLIALWVIACKDNGSRRKTIVFVAVASALLAFSAFGLSLSFPILHDAKAQLVQANELLPEDYIASDRLVELTLADLENSLGEHGEGEDAWPVYIGRSDCGECAEFEGKLIPALEKLGARIDAYYTSQDRDGQRSDDMYKLLDSMGVVSVPCVVVIGDGKVLYRWDDPGKSLDEIVLCLVDGRLPDGTSVY